MISLLFSVLGFLLVDVQLRAVDRDVDLRDVLSAVFRAFDPQDDLVILAARTLDKAEVEALRHVRPRTIVYPNADVPLPMPDYVIVIDKVTLAGHGATVSIRRGPMPKEIDWTCGFQIAIPLRRTGSWQVLPEAIWPARCAIPGPPGLPSNRDRLLEATRLALTAFRLASRVQVVAGPELSSEALAALEAIKKVPSGKDFADERNSLKADVFLVRRLEQEGDVVRIEGTLGPVPRLGGLACGVGLTVKLRRLPDGWTFEEQSLRMC